ncbi:hypothetical protein Tco_1391304 [Tanacetum coccineum]
MANENFLAHALIRFDDQILPFAAWVSIGKSSHVLDLQKRQKNLIFQIVVNILQNTNFFKAFTAYASLDEDWFTLDANLLREALEITPIDQARLFVSPPSGDVITDFVNELGYLELMWEEFVQAMQTFLTDKANLGSPTKNSRKHKPYVIPYCPFTKLIICHLGRIHNIHQRSASPFHLAKEDLRLGNLKFVSKGEIDEVFGMPIPNELISNNIRNASYYNAYLEMVAKHDQKVTAEKEGKKKSTSTKQPKPNPAIEKLSKPAPASKPKVTKEKPSNASTAKPPKLKPAKEKSTKATPLQKAGKDKVAKVRNVKSSFQLVNEPDEEPAHSELVPKLEQEGVGDNKPPMLEKHLYDSWKSRMELYMLNRPHGRMILASVEKGPLVWPSITVEGVTRLKEYTELTPAEAIQADCDIKAINIILQGLPTEIYALVSQHRVAKDLWEKIKLLMQGTSLTKQERECKLYDEFDKFTYKKGESLHEYYLRFTLLLNDMNIYKMPLEQFQYQSSVHHNVYSPQPSIPQSEYAPTSYQQQQSDPDSGLVVPVFQKGDDPIDAIYHMMSFLTAVVTSRYPTTNNQLRTSSNPRQQATIYEGKTLIVDELNSASMLSGVNLSRNGSDALIEVHNPDNLTYDLINQREQIMTSSEQSNDVNQTETKITSDSNIIPYSQYLSETQQETVQNSNSSAQQDVLILSIYKEEVKDLKEMQNVENSFSGSNEQYAEIVRLKQTLSEQVQEKDSLMKTVSDLKKDLKMEENRI